MTGTAPSERGEGVCSTRIRPVHQCNHTIRLHKWQGGVRDMEEEKPWLWRHLWARPDGHRGRPLAGIVLPLWIPQRHMTDASYARQIKHPSTYEDVDHICGDVSWNDCPEYYGRWQLLAVSFICGLILMATSVGVIIRCLITRQPWVSLKFDMHRLSVRKLSVSLS